MADRMPPPGLTVVIGAHPKGDMPGKMQPPGMQDKPAMGQDGKVSPDDAEVYRSDQTCVQCHNYDPTSGDCAKVSGSFDPGDGCIKFFEAIGEDEPDGDESGEMPDDDADDQGQS